MKKGEVWLTDFPQGKGFEQYGIRPALVLAGANGLVTVIPFTTNLSRESLNFALTFESSAENGLTQSSVLLIYQIGSLDESRLKRKLGWIPQEQRVDVNEMLKTFFKL